MSSKPGTGLAVFGSYFASISVSLEGPMGRYDVPWQSQIVNLTAEQAKDAESQPFVYFVSLVTESLEEPETSY